MRIAGYEVDIERIVLNDLDLERMVPAGDEIRACCPFHKERNPSFGINLKTGLFNCFGCGAKGNFKKLIMEIKGFDYDEAIEFLINYSKEIDREKVCADATNKLKNANLYIPKGIYKGKEEEKESAKQKEIPLEKRTHSYLRKRGITLKTQKEFGIYYNREDKRIYAPIRKEGLHVGFIKRSVTGAEPKYLFEFFDGKLTDKLYDMHTIPDRKVILVEGMMDMLKVWQADTYPPYAVMGSRVYDEQIEWLKENGVRTIILSLDGDTAGLRGTVEAFNKLRAQNIMVEVAGYPEGKKDPGECHSGELRYIYSHTLSEIEWRKKFKERLGDGMHVEKSARRCLELRKGKRNAKG